ncbi:MAG TPA: radical SAM family heme chaperone HemW [Candidatus Dependentiae bacterium]|nr:radical SAM family heme chaperone HemW [Candidatus Dependentiae bacterium]
MPYNQHVATRSLYIHWPFCPYRCYCCPFIALASHDQFMERYHKALTQEINQFGQQGIKKLVLDTIYFGGGTPSTYPDELLLDTFAILNDIFVIQKNAEITIEINPGTVNPEQLCLWSDIGINRLSIGVQSLKDNVLHKLNRLKKVEEVYSVIEHAQGVFHNISIDLILGLPGVSIEEWKDMLHQVVTWPITHIYMDIFMVHDNRPLYSRVKTEKVTLPCDDEVVDLYYWSRDFFADHGLQQYEIASFSRPNFESQHNTVYWERKPYKGFGLGACSFDGKRRFQNEKNLINYMEGIECGKEVTIFTEQLTKEQVRLEKIMLGLRRSTGITWDELLTDLSVEQEQKCKNEVVQLKQRNVLREHNGRLQLTSAGLVIENDIIIRLSL